MGKFVKKTLPVLATVAGIAAAIPTGGTSLLATKLGVSSLAAAGIAGGLSIGSSLLAGPSVPKTEVQLGRLQATLDPLAARKLVLGRTAMPPDTRYYEGSGEDERTIEYIIACAAHRIQSFEELWIEDELAWSAAGGLEPQFADFLGVEGFTEGGPAATRAINGGARWGSDDRLTGCAYLYVRVERVGTEENPSPFPSGLPPRITVIGTGMQQYDPRFDSTVPGGSGPQRADQQDTWGAGDGNPIIQALNVLLGWRINGKLSVGGGIPAKYIDMQSVITAANICDEPIALASGGTQPRYRTAGAFSTKDSPMQIVAALLAGCAGDLQDANGKFSFLIKANTLSTPIVTLSEDNLLSVPKWEPMGGQTNLPNTISGSFTDPSNNSLYQLVPYPSVSLPSEDGIDRVAPLDLGTVENSPQSERLAKQTLQRMQYPGRWSGEYDMLGLAATVGRIVHINHATLGWVAKPFRVRSQKVSQTGRIALVLDEENAAIYAWSAEDSAPVQAAVPVAFNRLNTGPILLARQASLTADWSGVRDDNGNRPVDNATRNPGATGGANLVRFPSGQDMVDDWIGDLGLNIDVPPGATATDRSVNIQDAFRQGPPYYVGNPAGKRFKYKGWVKTTGHTGGNFNLRIRDSAALIYPQTLLSGSDTLAAGQDWTYMQCVIQIEAGGTANYTDYTPAIDLVANGGTAPRVFGFVCEEIPIVALSELDPAQDGKLNSVEENATEGATWGGDITNQPSDAALLNENQEWSDLNSGPASDAFQRALALGTMNVGGGGNVRFVKNVNSTGAGNVGEIRVLGDRFLHPDGTNRSITDDDILTAYEGSSSTGQTGTFYVIYTDTELTTRFPGFDYNRSNFFVATYNEITGQWTARDNVHTAFNFTPVDSDCIVAVGTRFYPSTGITTLFSFLSADGNLYEPGATEGATWNNNIGGQPANLAGLDPLQNSKLNAIPGNADNTAENIAPGVGGLGTAAFEDVGDLPSGSNSGFDGASGSNGFGTGGWVQVLRLTLNNVPAGRLRFNSFGLGGQNQCVPSSVSGNETFFEARFRLVDGGSTLLFRNRGPRRMIENGGTIPFGANFNDLFTDPVTISTGGTVTLDIEVQRTSGSGSVLSSTTSMDVTIEPDFS